MDDDASFESARTKAHVFAARLTSESRTANMEIKAAYWADGLEPHRD